VSVHDGTQTNPVPVRDLLSRIHAENLVISYHRLTAAGHRYEAARLRAQGAARAVQERRSAPARLMLTRSAVRHLSFVVGALGLLLGFAIGTAVLLDDRPTGYVKACISCHGVTEQPTPQPSARPS
jgi:hypothetical protein